MCVSLLKIGVITLFLTLPASLMGGFIYNYICAPESFPENPFAINRPSMKECFMGIENQIQSEVNEIRHGQSRVEKIKAYLSNNLTADLSTAAVSQKFDLSVSTLRHIFKNHQQQSYRHYLEALRMNKALELIKEGKWVKEVMAATGYTNRSTFNIAFKKRFKYPASHFKK